VQAPVGDASTPELAAAVSNAGGLGCLSITWREPSGLPALLRRTRALTERRVAVNLVLAWDPAERLEIALAEGFRVVSFFWGDPAPWIGRVHAAGGLVMHTVASAERRRGRWPRGWTSSSPRDGRRAATSGARSPPWR
jgi:NAD(P)H-dependent flavin oxidoreductase YrpB (nitropropane dioxygenase family)